MKIGIIVHSYSGNTYSVVKKLKEKFVASGHSVDIERIKPEGVEQTKIKNVNSLKLERYPDVSLYDALIFSAPVRGASISPVLSAYLAQVSSLENKKVACFVTEAFPYPWMGGNRAISQMKKICESKGAIVSRTGIVNWMSKQRDKKIDIVVEELSKMF